MSENRNPDERGETGRKTISASRRGVLKSLGVAGAATMVGIPALSGSGAAAASGFDADTFEKGVAKRYGNPEAKVITKIVSKWTTKVENGDIGRSVATNRATAEIVQNSNTPKATKDIRQEKTFSEQFQSQPNSSSSDTTEDNTQPTYHTDHAANLNFVGGRKNRHGTINTRVNTFYKIQYPQLDAVSNSAGLGKGHAECRIFAHHRLGETRTHAVRCRYHRQGYVHNANAEVRLYIRPHGGHIIRKTVDSLPKGSVDENVTQEALFYMRKGTKYTVGIELYVRSDADVGQVSDADYYNGGERITPYFLRVT